MKQMIDHAWKRIRPVTAAIAFALLTAVPVFAEDGAVEKSNLITGTPLGDAIVAIGVAVLVAVLYQKRKEK